MVNTLNVSQYTGQKPPENNNADRSISGGPIYSPEQIKEVLAEGEQAITLWTRKCIKDVRELGMDTSDVIRLIDQAIANGQYRGSEWCQQNSGRSWAACDAYRLVRKEVAPATNKEMDCEYYLKFAVAKTGNVILTVSCHI